MLRRYEFEPRFQPVTVEGGTDRIVFLEFEMAIMRGRGAEADPDEQPAAGIDLAAHVEAILDDIEPRRFLLLARLGRVTDGHAVEAVVMAVRDAEVAAVGDPRGARARGPRQIGRASCRERVCQYV